MNRCKAECYQLENDYITRMYSVGNINVCTKFIQDISPKKTKRQRHGGTGKGVSEIINIHPRGTMNTCRKFHGSPANNW